MKKALVILSLSTAAFLFNSCSKDNGGSNNPPLDCATVTNKAWAADVNPIIQATCNSASCHDVASVNGPGPLTNYAQVFSARATIRANVASGNMPRNTTLTTTQKNAILCWIDSGAPNN